MSEIWHYGEPENGILRVTIGRADEPVNSLSRESLLELRTLIEHIRGAESVNGVLFISSKPGNFIAGADVRQIKDLNTRDEAREISQLGQQIFQDLEDLKVITVALISGACLGGGFEFAMACDYRIADESSKTLIGLPEVKLGLIPGWGGTVRMPELAGLVTALPLILAGKMISGKQARSKGLVHDVVPTEALESVGQRVIEVLHDRREPRKVAAKLFRTRRKSLVRRLIEGNGLIKRYALSKATREVEKNTHGHYPAPQQVIEVLRGNLLSSRNRAFARESEAISQLAESPVTTECMRLFFLQEEAKKPPQSLSVPLDAKSIRRGAVVGAGAMGAGVALLMARRGIHTRLKDIKPEFLAAGMKTVRGLLRRGVKRRRITPLQAEQAMDHLSPALDYRGLTRADVVIEAIVEDLEIKRAVFAELAAATSPSTVLATNTSSLRVSDISRDVPHPERVIGLHFFNPPHRMPLVEIIRTEQTSPEALATGLALVNLLGKTGVIVGDCAGFLVNRLLSPYMNEAGHLLADIDDPMEIERAAIEFGMPMGPLELSDLVGLEVAAHVARNMHEAWGDRMQPAPLWQRLQTLQQGSERSKVKLVVKEKKEKKLSSGVSRVVSQMKRERGIPEGIRLTREAIIQRLVYPVINEAAMCLDEGIAMRPEDIDLAMVFGTGFAPFRGGPLRYAETIGVSRIVDTLEKLAQVDARLAPGDALKRLGEQGGGSFSALSPLPLSEAVA